MFLKQLITDPVNLQLHMGANPNNPKLVRFRIMQMTEAGLIAISTFNDTNSSIEGEEYLNMQGDFNHTVLVQILSRWINSVLSEYKPVDTGDPDVSRFASRYHNETANHIQDDWEVEDYTFIKVGYSHESTSY